MGVWESPREREVHIKRAHTQTAAAERLPRCPGQISQTNANLLQMSGEIFQSPLPWPSFADLIASSTRSNLVVKSLVPRGVPDIADR